MISRILHCAVRLDEVFYIRNLENLKSPLKITTDVISLYKFFQKFTFGKLKNSWQRQYWNRMQLCLPLQMLY